MSAEICVHSIMEFPNPFQNDLIIPIIIKYLEIPEIKNTRLVSKKWNHHILYAIKKGKIRHHSLLSKLKKVTINDDIVKFNQVFCYNANGDRKSDQDREDSMFFTHFTISNSIFFQEELNVQIEEFIRNFGEKILNLKLNLNVQHPIISPHFTNISRYPISFPNLKYLNFNLVMVEVEDVRYRYHVFTLSCFCQDVVEQEKGYSLPLPSLEEVYFTHNSVLQEPVYFIDTEAYKFFARNAPKLVSINLPTQINTTQSINEKLFIQTFSKECSYIHNIKELYFEEVDDTVLNGLLQWSKSKNLQLRKFHFAQMNNGSDNTDNRDVDLEHFVLFINYQKDTLEDFSFNCNWSYYRPAVIDFNFFEIFQQIQFTQLQTLELNNNYLPGAILRASKFPALTSLSLSNYCHPNGHEFMEYISLWDQLPNLKILKLLKFEIISETGANEYFETLAEKFPHLEILELNIHILSPLYENISNLFGNWTGSLKELTIRFQTKAEIFCPARLTNEHLLKMGFQISGKNQAESQELLLKAKTYSKDKIMSEIVNGPSSPVAQMSSLEILRIVGQVLISDICGYSICQIKSLKLFEVSKDICLLSKECIEVLNTNNIEVKIV